MKDVGDVSFLQRPQGWITGTEMGGGQQKIPLVNSGQ